MQSGILNEDSKFVESPPEVVAPVEQENPPPTYVEPIAEEDFYQPDSDISPPIYDEPIVEESPPTPLPRRDFAKQDEYRQRLEMNQRIREFKAELPDDMDADDRCEAIRIYTLQEREKIKK